MPHHHSNKTWGNPFKPGQSGNPGGRPKEPLEERARKAARRLTVEDKANYYAPLVRLAVSEFQRRIEKKLEQEGSVPGGAPAPVSGVIRSSDESELSEYRGRLTGIMVQKLMSECPMSQEGETWEALIVMRTLTLALKGNSTALREVWTRIEGKVDQNLILSPGAGRVPSTGDPEEDEVNRLPWTTMLKMRYQNRLAAGMSEQEASAVPLPPEESIPAPSTPSDTIAEHPSTSASAPAVSAN